MKILFLGTGAADWTKADIDNPEYRRNASALIDEKLLIDPGPCVPEAIEKFNVDVKKIEYVIITHLHGDHYNEQTLEFLRQNGAKLIEFNGKETKKAGNYEITALVGNHSIPVKHYIISDGEKKLFYGLDSAWLMYDEVREIKKNGIDFAVFDATVGFSEGDFRLFEHNDLRMVIEMKATLNEYIKRFCISHMARTLHSGHRELEEKMKEYNIETAFDGLETEI